MPGFIGVILWYGTEAYVEIVSRITMYDCSATEMPITHILRMYQLFCKKNKRGLVVYTMQCDGPQSQVKALQVAGDTSTFGS